MEVDRYFLDQGVTVCRTSPSVASFEERFLARFGLTRFVPEIAGSLPGCVFVGVYSSDDVLAFLGYAGKKRLLFCGSDTDLNRWWVRGNLVWMRSVESPLVLSKEAQQRLQGEGIQAEVLSCNLVDYSLFFPRKVRGQCVYVYDGFRGDVRPETYGLDVVQEVVRQLPGVDFIYSSQLFVSYEMMPDIYARCGIVLRLTPRDGNANTVQEAEAMGIPAVHNQSDYGLKWETADDVVAHIKEALA